MRFRTRRGRPAVARAPRDAGTPELQHKRSMQMTAEPLDLYLSCGIISEAQHRAGIRLRWLHSLFFGTASPSASPLLFLDERTPGTNDEDWLKKRYEEYQQAMMLLQQNHGSKSIIRLCIYHELASPQSHQQQEDIRSGLTLLSDLWNSYTSTPTAS